MSDNISLYECVEATRDRGVVGERKNILTGDVAAIAGEKVLYNGPSRGGKDEIIDSIEWLWHRLPDVSGEIDWEQEYYNDVKWYHWPSETSPKAPFYNAPTINMFPFQRFMDFVSIDESIESIAKAFGEDKAATHEKVDVSLSDSGGTQDQIVDMVLEAPHACFFTIASDNKKINFQEDFEEFRKRVIVMDTDASAELTRRIQQRQAEIRAGLYEPRVDSERLSEIRNHHNNIPIDTFTKDNGGGEIIDTVSVPVVNQEPIPARFVEGRYDNQKLMDMVEGVTLFHHDRRLKIPAPSTDSGKHQLVTAPADAYHGMKIFGENMVMSALNLKDIDKIILKHLRQNPNTNFTTLDLQEVLQAEGLNPQESRIRQSLDAMKDKLYVQKDEGSSGSRVEYRASYLGKEIALEGSEILDWEQVVDDTKEVAKQVLPDKWADRYINDYCEGSGLIVTHPITGETVNILEDNEFESKVQEGQEGMEDAMNTPLYGSDEDEEEDEMEEELEERASQAGSSEPKQGTL